MATRELEWNKAIGNDNIFNEIIKYGANDLLISGYHYIFNNMIKHRITPHDFNRRYEKS